MRPRVVIGVAMAIVLGVLALDMSASASRIAGTDHANYLAFSTVMQGGQEMCQTGVDLPAEAAFARMEIATNYAPLPNLSLRFRASGGRVLTTSYIRGGGPQGVVTFPLRYPHGGTVAGSLCVRAIGSGTFEFAGETWPPGTPGSSEVQGVSQAGRIGLFYLSPSESWWSLLPRLSERLGFGKAGFFGSWTLALAAVLMIFLWVGVARLLSKELS